MNKKTIKMDIEEYKVITNPRLTERLKDTDNHYFKEKYPYSYSDRWIPCYFLIISCLQMMPLYNINIFFGFICYIFLGFIFFLWKNQIYADWRILFLRETYYPRIVDSIHIICIVINSLVSVFFYILLKMEILTDKTLFFSIAMYFLCFNGILGMGFVLFIAEKWKIHRLEKFIFKPDPSYLTISDKLQRYFDKL